MLALFVIASLILNKHAYASQQSPAHTHVAVLNLQGTVGLEITHTRIINAATSLQALTADNPKHNAILILKLKSQGGKLNALPALSDAIYHARTNQEIRIVFWIESAASAAALLALNSPDIVMAPTGFIGGAITTDQQGKPISNQDLQAALFVGRTCALRGGHDQHFPLAMQTDQGLVILNDNSLAHDLPHHQPIEILATQGEPAVLNARQAIRTNLAHGQARTLKELYTLLNTTTVPSPSSRITAIEDADTKRSDEIQRLYKALSPLIATLNHALGHPHTLDPTNPPTTTPNSQIQPNPTQGIDALNQIEHILSKHPQTAEHVLNYLNSSPDRRAFQRETLESLPQ